jgi:predicted secreted protein
MSTPISIAVYVTIWFVVLFAILPFGVRSLDESGEVPPGADPGAPVAPRLLAKVVWTTIVSTIVFVVVYYLGMKYA